jgi:hypothetical protein
MPELAAAFEAMVAAVVEQCARARSLGPAEEMAFEATLGERGAAVEVAAHTVTLRALDIDVPALMIGGELYRRVLRSPGVYKTMAGEARFERTLYRKARERNGPTLDIVGLRAGVIEDGWLPATARAMAHYVQQGTSREAEKTAQQTGRLPYSRSSFERVAHAVGRRYCGERDRIELAVAQEEAVPDEARSLSVSLDRVAVPMEEPRERGPGRPRRGEAKRPVNRVFRMAYVGTVTLHDKHGEALHTIRYGTMPGGDEKRLAMGLADDALRLLAKRPRLRVMLLCDGAPEMWNLLEAEFDAQSFGQRPVRRLVDFYHLIEKLTPAAKVIFGEEHGKRVVRWKLALLNRSDARADILRELRDSGCEDVVRDGEKPVHDAITYLERHHGRMDYARARSLGLPIGSGNVEATCKSLVNTRMKRAGCRWKIDTGEHIIQLRALALSDRWDRAMELALGEPSPRIRRAA